MTSPTSASPPPPARRVRAACLLGALFATAAACGDGAPADLAADHAQRDDLALAARVDFAPLEPARDATLVTLPGEVTLPPNASPSLAPPLAGRLRAWAVSLGAAVTAGAPLATLESPALTDLEAEARELSRVLDARRRLASRERAHVAEGLVGATTLFERELGVAEAAARLEAVRAQLAARSALGADAGAEWTWRAPIDGVVSALRCSPGAMVGPDSPCVTLLAIADAELRVHVPERLLGLVDASTRARFTAAAAPDAPIDLALSRVEPSVDPRSRTRAHHFTLPPCPPDGPCPDPLLPGASGRVDLVVAAPPGVFRVPAAAVTRLDGADVIFVAAAPDADEPGGATPIPVERVGRHGAHALVRAPGLTPDMRVAVGGIFLLKSLRAFGESGEAPTGEGHGH